MNEGTLYAIGVGPGSADLLTVRAVRILEKVDVILAAASPANSYSSCLEIVKPYLGANKKLERLDFPMTRNAEKLEKAWYKAATRTLEILEAGTDAAFLTIGDPLIYSTFCYLLAMLRKIRPDVKVSIVPGITSFQAAAAQNASSLCEGVQTLKILSGIRPQDELLHELQTEDTVVILKVYRNYDAIYNALAACGRADNAILASNVETANEEMQIGLKQGLKPGYMSLIISRPRD